MADATAQVLQDSDFPCAFALTPADQFVIWNGCSYDGQSASIVSRVLDLVEAPWTPVSLRVLVALGSRAPAGALDPSQVRNAIRRHQGASGAAYFLVRRTFDGDYVSVTDIPFPSARSSSIRSGEVVLSRSVVQPPRRAPSTGNTTGLSMVDRPQRALVPNRRASARN